MIGEQQPSVLSPHMVWRIWEDGSINDGEQEFGHGVR